MNKKKLFILMAFIANIVFSQVEFSFNTQVSPSLSIQQYFPDLIVDDEGSIHLVWVEQTGNSKNIFYSYSEDNGLSFSEKIQINSVNGHVVAYGGAGPRIQYYNSNIYVIWADSRNGYNNTSIFMSRSSNNGESWINDFMVSDQSYFQLYGDMEIDEMGVLHLVYYNYQSNLHFSDIRYSKMYLDGMMLTESIALGVTTDVVEPCDCCSPDIAVSPIGDVYIAYRNNIGNIRDHYITTKLENEDSFSEAVPIAELNDEIGFCPSSSPSISIQNNQIGAGGMFYEGGGVFITFGNLENLQFQNPIMVEPQSSINNYPNIILNNSIIYAIWVDATNKEILFSSLNSDGNIIDGFQNIIIADENITQVSEPKLKLYNDNLYAVWADNRSGVSNIYFSSTQEFNIVVGDVNGDVLINIIDILLVVNHIIGNQEFTPTQFIASDLNSDSVINILDVIQIINIILGNI